jgi:hypothetical protein
MTLDHAGEIVIAFLVINAVLFYLMAVDGAKHDSEHDGRR